MSVLGFKGRMDPFLTCVILRFTSGVTPADCIEVSMAAEPFQSRYLRTCPQALVEVRGSSALFEQNKRVKRGFLSAQMNNLLPELPILSWENLKSDKYLCVLIILSPSKCHYSVNILYVLIYPLKWESVSVDNVFKS